MINVFKCRSEASLPTYATQFSACFDLYACLSDTTEVKIANRDNNISGREVVNSSLILFPGDRALIPTGLKFNIPSCNSVRLHPRSGLSFKSGLMLSNCEGVIDEDYCEEVFVSLFNSSTVNVVVSHNDRICQGEMVRDSRADIVEVYFTPTQKTDRTGGFGSTGK